MAMQIVSRSRHKLRTDVQLVDLFEAPTVSGLAAFIERRRESREKREEISIPKIYAAHDPHIATDPEQMPDQDLDAFLRGLKGEHKGRG